MRILQSRAVDLSACGPPEMEAPSLLAQVAQRPARACSWYLSSAADEPSSGMYEQKSALCAPVAERERTYAFGPDVREVASAGEPADRSLLHSHDARHLVTTMCRHSPAHCQRVCPLKRDRCTARTSTEENRQARGAVCTKRELLVHIIQDLPGRLLRLWQTRLQSVAAQCQCEL